MRGTLRRRFPIPYSSPIAPARSIASDMASSSPYSACTNPWLCRAPPSATGSPRASARTTFSAARASRRVRVRGTHVASKCTWSTNDRVCASPTRRATSSASSARGNARSEAPPTNAPSSLARSTSRRARSSLSFGPMASSAASSSSMRSVSMPVTSPTPPPLASTAVTRRSTSPILSARRAGVDEVLAVRTAAQGALGPAEAGQRIAPQTRRRRLPRGARARLRRGASRRPTASASCAWRAAATWYRAAVSTLRPPDGGQAEVVGEGDHVVGLRCLQRLADPSVPAHAGGQTYLLVQGRADERVREPVRPDAGLDEEPGGDGFVERIDEVVVLLTERHGEHLEREVHADRPHRPRARRWCSARGGRGDDRRPPERPRGCRSGGSVRRPPICRRASRSPRIRGGGEAPPVRRTGCPPSPRRAP